MHPLPADDLDHVLASTEGLWEELRGRRLFVTGGTGFFGLWLLESFARANERFGLGAAAVVLSRDPAGFRLRAPHLASMAGLRFHKGDVRSFAYPEGAFDVIIHAAGEPIARTGDDPLGVFATTAEGTLRVLDFAAVCGAKAMLFTSSGAVYGRQPADLTSIPEDYAGAPDVADARAAYGEGKRVAELLCHLHGGRGGLAVKIARCFAFIGPGMPLDGHFAVGSFVRDAVHGGPVRVEGDGTPLRSYLYASDLAVSLWTVLVRGMPGRAYNVGSPEARAIREVAEAIAWAVTPRCRVEVARQPAGTEPPSRYVPSVDRLARELGVRPAVPFDEAVRRTVVWHQRCSG
jgi:dTDP-glucose 4,6-dehydratase